MPTVETRGCLLVYPVHRSAPLVDSNFFTVVCVTNINLLPQTPISFGGSTLGLSIRDLSQGFGS